MTHTLTPVQKHKKFEAILSGIEDKIARALPGAITAERFTAVMLNEMRKTPKLYDCDPVSLLGGMFTAASMGLTFGTKECYLIPYGKSIQFQVGYIGLVRMMRRTGLIRRIYAMPVHENDEFKYSYGAGSTLWHRPADVPEGPPTHYYAFIEYLNGGSEWVVWTREKVEAHRDQYSKAKNSGPWKTAFDEMAKKTVLLALGKTQDLSFDISRAVATDGLSGPELAAELPIDAQTDEMANEYFETVQGEDVQEQIASNAKKASEAQQAAMDLK
jgi:recombination protein RecT